MTSPGRRDSFCKASARPGRVYRGSRGVPSMLTVSPTAGSRTKRSIYARPPTAKSPRGDLPMVKSPTQPERVMFSDTCEHAIHLKSSKSDLVVHEKAPSYLARAGDAVRPAQLLRDRRHDGGARRRHLVPLPSGSARARMDADRVLHHEGSALEPLGRAFRTPAHAGGPGALHDVLRRRHSDARADPSEDLRHRGDRDLV